MTAAEHAAHAEKCVEWAQPETDRDKRASLHARAQAHAVLAIYRELADLRAVLGGVRDELARGLR